MDVLDNLDNLVVEVTRGDLVESVHRGTIVVSDNEGEVLFHLGDPLTKTYIRSAAKPIQAIPVIESKAAEHFSLTEEEIAILTASHSGEVQHEDIVTSILDKLNLEKDNLQCGPHYPVHQARAKEMMANAKEPETVHNCCSGKHAGMLALALHQKYSLDDYYVLKNPVQQTMFKTISEFADLPKEELDIGIDGCGVPVFRMPIKNMALAYANLSNPNKFSPERQKACKAITEAMTKYPQMVAGSDRFTTLLMEYFKGRIVAKDGSEGIFCLGIPEKGLGVAIKIEDGAERALAPVVLRTLEELGILSEEDKEHFKDFYSAPAKNFRGETVGEVRPVFTLRS